MCFPSSWQKPTGSKNFNWECRPLQGKSIPLKIHLISSLQAVGTSESIQSQLDSHDPDFCQCVVYGRLNNNFLACWPLKILVWYTACLICQRRVLWVGSSFFSYSKTKTLFWFKRNRRTGFFIQHNIQSFKTSKLQGFHTQMLAVWQDKQQLQ